MRPSWLQVLENLQSEYEAQDAVSKTRSTVADDHDIEDLESVQQALQELQESSKTFGTAERANY